MESMPHLQPKRQLTSPATCMRCENARPAAGVFWNDRCQAGFCRRRSGQAVAPALCHCAADRAQQAPGAEALGDANLERGR
eukprot:9469871-Pyramimonas_sp.AAC.1